MLKNEFERIAGYKVSNDDYFNIIEPMYMATSLNKEDFVKTINRKVFEQKREYKKVIIGVNQLPNGTWMNYEAELRDVDIRTGKFKVKRLSKNRCWSEISFDIHGAMVTEV